MANLIHTFKRSYNLIMSPDGKLIAQTNASQINVFDSVSYKQIAQFKDIQNVNIVFSNDSKYLLAKSTDRKLGLYDLDELELIHKHTIKKNNESQDSGIMFSVDGKKIIDLVYNDSLLGYIAVWDMETWTETRYYEGENNIFDDICYSEAHGKYFISGFHRGGENIAHNIPFYLWFDVDKGLGTFHNTDFENNERIMLADKSNVILAYSGVGKKNATLTFITENKIIPLCDESIHEITLSRDNTRIAIMYTKNAIIYSFPDMKVLAELDTMNCFGNISFSPDGKNILIGTWKKGLVYEMDL